MKYLKILPFALVASLVSQEAMALREGTIQAAQAQVLAQQAAAQLLLDQNAYLGGIALPQNDDYRAAVLANGGHAGAPAIEVLILQVLETGGAAGILHGDGPQQAAVAAMLALPGADHTTITRDAVLAAVALQAFIAGGGGAGIPFTEANIRTTHKLIKPAVNLPVNLNNFNAAHYLRNPQGGGVAAPVNVVNVTAGVSLLTALVAPVHINAANVNAAILLAPFVAAGNQISQAQIDAVKAAMVNNAVRDAMVWAINNGFGGQPAGTIPAGIARVSNSAVVSTLIVIHGAVPFGATAGRFVGVGNNEMLVHQNHLGGGAPALNDVIVFTGAIDDPLNGANITVQNYAIAP